MSGKSICYETHIVQTKPDETILDAFIRCGVAIPFSCRGGSCQTCAVRCLEGDIPITAQKGLSDYQKQRGYLLTCCCIPTTDMTIAPLSPDDIITDAFVIAIQQPTVANPCYNFTFELARQRHFTVGDTFKIVDGTNKENIIKIIEYDVEWLATA